MFRFSRRVASFEVEVSEHELLTTQQQRLVETALVLAEEYPTRLRNRYKKAAKSLRSPYWDWAAQSTIPEICVPEFVKVNVPKDGSTATTDIKNPLRYYEFPNAAMKNKFGPFDDLQRPNVHKCQKPGEKFPQTANSLMQQRPYKRWTVGAIAISISR